MLSVNNVPCSKIFTEPLAAESHVFSRFACALDLTRSLSVFRNLKTWSSMSWYPLIL